MPGKKNMPTERADTIQPATAAGRIPQQEARRTPHLTVQERVKSGKEARAHCPRSDHAAWDPPGIRLFLQLKEAEWSPFWCCL
jgi:hypothetical protein